MTTKTGKHTPRELFFKPTASDNQGMIYGEDGKTIAVIYDRADGYGELFASAPELLEALKELDQYVHARYGNHGPLSMWDKVRNSIAKAEGRSSRSN